MNRTAKDISVKLRSIYLLFWGSMKLEEPMNRTAEDITVQLPLNLSFVLGFNEIRGADE